MTAPTSLTAQQVVQGAIELYQENGWVQEAYELVDPEGKRFYCVEGALRKVLGVLHDSDARQDSQELCAAEVTVAQAILATGYPDPYAGRDTSLTDAEKGFCTILDWNDTKGRTKDEVVAVLRKAAES